MSLPPILPVSRPISSAIQGSHTLSLKRHRQQRLSELHNTDSSLIQVTLLINVGTVDQTVIHCGGYLLQVKLSGLLRRHRHLLSRSDRSEKKEKSRLRIHLKLKAICYSILVKPVCNERERQRYIEREQGLTVYDLRILSCALYTFHVFEAGQRFNAESNSDSCMYLFSSLSSSSIFSSLIPYTITIGCR